MQELSAEELARRSGVTAERLRHLVELGLIAPTPDGRHRTADIQRIRVVDALADAGIAPEQLVQLIAVGAYDLDWTDVVFPEPTAQGAATLDQAAAATGLPGDLAERLFDAWELPRPQLGQPLRADEDELLRQAVPALAGFGQDPAALLGAARQLGDSLRRLAESQVRLFHRHVDERLDTEGHPEHAWSDDLTHVAAAMMASLERTVVLLYRRQFEHYVLDVTTLRAEAGLERAGLARRRPVRPPAIAFLDLTGYTSLTEERGDRAAAELAGRLTEIVYDRAQDHGGRPVKLLGDGVMFHFPDPPQGVRCGLELVDRIPAAGLPLARVGLHCGPVVFQDGDYFGRTVNVAARIGDHARPGEVLVSEDVAAADGSGAVRYDKVGPVSLKGLAAPITLYTAVPRRLKEAPMPGGQPTEGQVTVATLQRLVAAFNAHDLDAVMAFFTDDCVLELPRGPHPWGRRFEGREQVRSGLATRFAGIPDVHYGNDQHWVSGNRGCSAWLLTGTTTQGEPIEVQGCDLFEFRGDKIARKDSYWKLVERGP